MESLQPLLNTAEHSPSPSPEERGSPPDSPTEAADGDDVMKNTAVTEPVAPPPSSDQISGYDAVGFANGGSTGVSSVPPPPADPVAQMETQGSSQQADVPTFTEDEVKEALVSMVATHCCYGKSPAQDLIVTNLIPSNAFHYQLETFTESRMTAWEYEPFTGQVIDGPLNGPAPLPWDIPAQPSQLFQDHVKHFEVPHSASVKSCHGCHGSGMNQCQKCTGRGQVTCSFCSGSGRRAVHHDHHDHHGHNHHHHHVNHVTCHTCHGSGRRTCSKCSGHGTVQCELCLARGKLKCYIKLTVTWKTHKAEHIVERTALPDELIKDAQGIVALQEEQVRVAPVSTFPDAEVNDSSANLVQQHATSFPSERTLMQRHWVRVVPVVEVHSLWKSKTFKYFVYGKGHRVYAPDYPQKVCWGCTLL